MTEVLNKIRNPEFRVRGGAIQAWAWNGSHRGVDWQQPEHRDGHGVLLRSRRAGGTCSFQQIVTCKPNSYYLVAAKVTCDLRAPDETSGFVIRVHFEVPRVDSRNHRTATGSPLWSADSEWVTPGLHRALEPIEVRAYLEIPVNVRRVEVSVGMDRAAGTAWVHLVRFMSIVEPDEEAHILAIPPPTWLHARTREALNGEPESVGRTDTSLFMDHHRGPKTAARLGICSQADSPRPLSAIMSEFLGPTHVHRVSPDAIETLPKEAALLLPDADPPEGLRSVTDLERLAKDRIIVISLPAFARLSRGAAVVRRVEQPDDPIHAKVVHASDLTHGFALADVFPYAWRGTDGISFVQNHFRTSPTFARFCARHRYTTLLASMCAHEVNCDRPIALFKKNGDGTIFVLDVEPVEAIASSCSEPSLALHFLTSLLGHIPCRLGQYVVPDRTESALRDRIREMGCRFSAWRVHEDDAPWNEITEQLVTIGAADDSFGLPLPVKPLILVRSGLQAGDAESVYGTFLWFKQLVRMPPHACAYSDALASRFRLAWIPSAASWSRRDGFGRSQGAPRPPLEIECEDGCVAAWIDVESLPKNQARLVVPRTDGPYQPLVDWLPRIAASFPAGRYFEYTVGDGEGFADRSRYAWRWTHHEVRVEAAPTQFKNPVHRRVIDAGGLVLRLEIPGCDFDFPAHSIARTDLTATLLEQTIGLLYGMVVVNRDPIPLTFDGFPPLSPGEALVLPHHHPALRAWTEKAG